MRTLKLEQPQGLVAVLAHRASEFGDRHDAAMNLGAFDEPEAEAALLAVASDLSEDPDIADAAGESLSEVWARKGRSEPGLIAKMHPEARKFFVP
jgi:HEAT repeat protein